METYKNLKHAYDGLKETRKILDKKSKVASVGFAIGMVTYGVGAMLDNKALLWAGGIGTGIGVAAIESNARRIGATEMLTSITRDWALKEAKATDTKEEKEEEKEE